MDVKSIYNPVIDSTCRYIHLWGGRSRGASHFATNYFLYRLTLRGYFRGGFVRATFSEIKNSLYRAFKDRLADAVSRGMFSSEDFVFNETELSVTYKPTGNTIISKGLRKSNLAQSANLKGLEGLTHVIVEEAEDSTEEDVMKLDDTLRTTAVEHIQILFLFNPPSINHYLIRRNYYLVAAAAKNKNGFFFSNRYTDVPNDLPLLLYIHATYEDNLHFVHPSTIANFSNYGDPDSPWYNPDFYCRNVLGLVSEGRHGRILTHVKPITNREFEELPYPSFFGLDWGFNDPNAVAELKHHDGRLYVRQLIYRPGMDNEELMIAMRQAGVMPHHRVYYDCARPDNARTFKKGIAHGPHAMKGYNMIASRKGPDSIRYGLRELQNVELYAVETSRDLWIEVEEYHWACDADKQPTDEPADEMNHLIDAIRYAYIGEVKSRHTPVVAAPDAAAHAPAPLPQNKNIHNLRDEVTGDIDDDDLEEFFE